MNSAPLPRATHVAELIAGRPEQLCVVLATRHDPQLGLHRLRLTGQLTEIREADLRFNLAETRELLEAARVRLDDDSLAQLHGTDRGLGSGAASGRALAGRPSGSATLRRRVLGQ